MTKRKVLIIDDSELVLALVQEELLARGYDVITRGNPLGSGAMILREKPDLVLLDVTMPTLGGEDILELMRRHQADKKTRIVLYSSRSEEELERISQSYGAHGFIRKGPDMQALAEAVQHFIDTPSSEHATDSRPTTDDDANDDDAYILFVDEDEASLRHFRHAFNELSCTAYVSSGSAALHALKAAVLPSALVISLSLTDLSAPDLYRKALALHHELAGRFIFTAEQQPSADMLRFIDNADETLLLKPIDLDTLRQHMPSSATGA